MGVVEALILVFLGFVVGVIATVADVLLVGSASFISHVALWMMLNTLLATHVENRLKAVWWSIPFNFGFIECYFLTTSASYEGFSKSLVVPLAGMAVLSPLLTYALWTAKNDKGPYGRALSLLAVSGTLVASYLLNQSVSFYCCLMCVVMALFLFVIHTRKVKITPAVRGEATIAELAPFEEGDEYGPQRWEIPEEDMVASSARKQPASKGRRWGFGRGVQEERTTRRRDFQPQDAEQAESLRPTRRAKGSSGANRVSTHSSARSRRAEEEREAREREARLAAASERRARNDDWDDVEPQAQMSTLGNTRRATRSHYGRGGGSAYE